MRKVLYAILNYRRSFENTKKLYDSLPADNVEDIIILRKDMLNFHEKKQFKDIVIKPVASIAKSKNMILNYAKEHGYEYCFIIEDDMIIKKETAFDLYLNLMDELEYKVLFYPYDKRNRVISNIKPNPCLAVRVQDDIEIYVSRTPCSSLILFKVSDDMQMFDEKLKVLEMEHYLWDSKESGGIKSYGFFPDIPMSWTYFDNTNEDKRRVVTRELGAMDMKYKNISFSLDLNADVFLAFLQKTYNKELDIEVNGKEVV